MDKVVSLTGTSVDFVDVVETISDVVDGPVEVGAVTEGSGLRVCHSDVAETLLVSTVEVSKTGSYDVLSGCRRSNVVVSDGKNVYILSKMFGNFE